MEKKVILITAAVSAALLGGAVLYARANAAQVEQSDATDVDMGQPPVYFMPAGNSNAGDYSSNAGGNNSVLPADTGLGGVSMSAFPYMSTAVAANTPIPVNPIFSDPVMASQAIAESQIQAGLVDSLAQYGAAMMSNVLNLFAANNVNPSKFTGTFDVTGGKTTFSYDSFLPEPVIGQPLTPQKKTYTAADIVVPSNWNLGESGDPLYETVLGQFQSRHTAQFGQAFSRAWGSDAGAVMERNRIVDLYTQQKLAQLNA